MSMVADIIINHLDDITISSISGNYQPLVLRVISEGNTSITGNRIFIVQARTGNDFNEPSMPLNVQVFPLSGETITFDNITQISGASSSHIHYGLVGGQRISGSNGLNDGLETAGSLSVMGRIGIGTSSNDSLNEPRAKLHINNRTSALSMLVEDDNAPDSTPFLISNDGNVHIGTSSVNASTKLNVIASAPYGGFRLQDTTQAPGRLLISDAEGDASWTASSGVLASLSGVTGSGTALQFPYWNTASSLSSRSEFFTDPTNNPFPRFGMGLAPIVNTRLQIGWTMSDLANTESYGAFLKSDIVAGNSTSTMLGIKQGIRVETEIRGGSGTVSNVVGALVINRHTANTKSDDVIGFFSRTDIAVGATANDIKNFSARNYTSESGSTTTKGRSNRQIGYHAQELTGATNNYAFYQEGENTKSFFQGRIGIGTEEPTARLHISGNSSLSNPGGAIRIQENGLAPISPTFSSIVFAAADNTTRNYISTFNSGTVEQDFMKIGSRFGNIELTTGDLYGTGTPITTRMIVTSQGRVGIGLTGPSALLAVAGTGLTMSLIIASGSSNTDLVRITQTGTGNALVVEDSNNPDANPFVISNSGQVGIGLTGPSASLHIKAMPGTTSSTLFKVDGNAGELLTVVDTLNGSLMSVNDISGLPVLEVFDDNTILMGDYQAPALNSTLKVSLASAVTNQTIYQINTAIYTSVIFEYNVQKTTNVRAGIILAVWNGTTLEFTETSTMDIGNTSDISFNVAIGGPNANFRVTTASSGWTVKSIVRSI